MSTPFHDLAVDPPIRGFLHLPSRPSGKAIVLTHGAGANCQSKLLIEMSEALAASGFSVLRFDLPFRSERPHGPPSPGGAARDREGLRRAVLVMKERQRGPVFLGGHSYGGRQSSILVSEDPRLASSSKACPASHCPSPEAVQASFFRPRHTRSFRNHPGNEIRLETDPCPARPPRRRRRRPRPSCQEDSWRIANPSR